MVPSQLANWCSFVVFQLGRPNGGREGEPVLGRDPLYYLRSIARFALPSARSFVPALTRRTAAVTPWLRGRLPI